MLKGSPEIDLASPLGQVIDVRLSRGDIEVGMGRKSISIPEIKLQSNLGPSRATLPLRLMLAGPEMFVCVHGLYDAISHPSIRP